MSKIDVVTKNIYSNLQDSYKEAAAKESKYKGEGTADFYKSQHIMVPPPQVNNLMAGRKSMSRTGSRIGHQAPKLARAGSAVIV